MLEQQNSSLAKVQLQKYVNLMLVLIGFSADLIALSTFVGLLHTPVTGSNFYVNSREFLAWVLIAVVYSVGIINAWIRRRWRRLYGTSRADHSILNGLWWFEDLASYGMEKETAKIKGKNFKRDFSILYMFMFLFTFLFGRAITATENAIGITPSPWGDLFVTAIITIFVTFGMMVITSMFDYAMSIFIGDEDPQDLGF